MSKSQGRNISLTPELLDHTKQMVASGKYDNISEYMRALIRRDRERHVYGERLLALIQEGLDSGEPIEMTPAELGAYARKGIERARRESDRRAG